MADLVHQGHVGKGGVPRLDVALEFASGDSRHDMLGLVRQPAVRDLDLLGLGAA